LTGAILGILIGLAAAVALARTGVWPPDQLTIFLLPAITGLIGLLLLSLGREGSVVTMVIALIILIPMAVWGALGLTGVNEQGELNGGCQVVAASDLDNTTVVDSSKADPFEIDPDGGLEWAATSPTPFMDYEWEIYVDLGGFAYPLDSGTEPNEGGAIVNGDDVDNIRDYADARGIDVDTMVGVYEVGGFAATCDGFGFVRLVSDGLDMIALIAMIVALVLLIILIILIFVGRNKVVASATVLGASEVQPPPPPEA
jgi:hypothetical protein